MEFTHDYTFNPDGSGKVSIVWKGPSPPGGYDTTEFISAEVGNAKGVDAWSDISCVAGEGLVFQATAYFSDISKLRFHCQGFHINVMDFTVSRDAKKQLVIENAVTGASKGEAATGNDKELKARLVEEREKFAMARGFIEGLLGELQCTATLHLPGKIVKMVNGKKVDATTAKLTFDGKEVMKVIDRLMKDDALAMKLLRSGKQGPEAFTDLMEGQGPLKITIDSKTKDLFDYETEVTAAKAAFEEFRASTPVARGPAEGEPLTNLRVVGLKVVREASSEREFTPMMESEPKVTLALAGDLPGPVLKLEECALEALVAADGTNLLPEDEWSRRIHFPKLTKDRRTAYFDVEIKSTAKIDGFREIRGVVRVKTSGAAEDVDLGIKALENGAEGTKLGARIERFEPEEERTTIELRLQVGVDSLLALKLVSGKEEKALDQRGYSSSSEECTVTYSIEGAIPKKAKLVARVARDLQNLSIPFALENVDLMGNPR